MPWYARDTTPMAIRMMAMTSSPFFMALHRTPALDDADQHHRDRDEQQHVDESAQGVRADHAYRPQHEQDDEDGPQHAVASSSCCATIAVARRRQPDEARDVPVPTRRKIARSTRQMSGPDPSTGHSGSCDPVRTT